MEPICLDTTILIEHYRLKDKSQSKLYNLSAGYEFKIPSVVKYQILCGDKKKDNYWKNLFELLEILPFDGDCADIAGNIYSDLKSINKLVGIDDILIASIAIKNKLKLSTLNVNHFINIKGLQLI
jgi:tRNA(fMet)-specific endonuclease VapC